jgi:hypothetical protein
MRELGQLVVQRRVERLADVVRRGEAVLRAEDVEDVGVDRLV